MERVLHPVVVESRMPPQNKGTFFPILRGCNVVALALEWWIGLGPPSVPCIIFSSLNLSGKKLCDPPHMLHISRLGYPCRQLHLWHFPLRCQHLLQNCPHSHCGGCAKINKRLKNNKKTKQFTVYSNCFWTPPTQLHIGDFKSKCFPAKGAAGPKETSMACLRKTPQCNPAEVLGLLLHYCREWEARLLPCRPSPNRTTQATFEGGLSLGSQEHPEAAFGCLRSRNWIQHNYWICALPDTLFTPTLCPPFTHPENPLSNTPCHPQMHTGLCRFPLLSACGGADWQN